MKGASLDIDALYIEHGAFLFAVIGRLVGTGDHVDDLLQETFITAFRNQKKFDPELGSSRGWLYGIAVNLCKRHERTQRRFFLFRTRLAQEAPDTVPRPDQALEDVRSERRMAHVLRTLPLPQREVFAMYELQGLSGGEIAQLLQIPEGTVWSRLHLARKVAQKLLRQQLGLADKPTSDPKVVGTVRRVRS